MLYYCEPCVPFRIFALVLLVPVSSWLASVFFCASSESIFLIDPESVFAYCKFSFYHLGSACVQVMVSHPSFVSSMSVVSSSDFFSVLVSSLFTVILFMRVWL